MPGNQVEFEVTDNGKGMDPALVRSLLDGQAREEEKPGASGWRMWMNG
ncbi:hypothetical protein ACFSQ7_20315 [Paenibacillus rhizoplanae]